jgi:stress-induced morphogen
VVIQQKIESKLQAELAPSHLEVINESHMHSVPKGSETHFKVVIVTDRFDGLSAVKRHQLVYGVLSEEMKSKPGIHALAITSRTPSEWAASPEANQSPLCASKKD